MTAMSCERITVGLPFFNCAGTLADAIRSVFAQTDRNWELLLLDDGSTDGSLDIARRVRDSRVTVVSDGMNLGLPARLNQICRSSSAGLLARMDGDDLMHPLRLATERAFLERNPAVDVVGTAAFVIDAEGRVTGRRGDTPFDLSAEGVLRHGLFIHPTVLGRRDWFARHPYDPSYVRAEDRELWSRTLESSRFARLDDALLFYREPQQVNVSNYLRSCRTDRKILRRYGPPIIGRAGVAAVVIESHLKGLCYRAAASVGRADLLVRRRNRPVPDSHLRAAEAAIACIRSTQVPGFDETGRPAAPVLRPGAVVGERHLVEEPA